MVKQRRKQIHPDNRGNIPVKLSPLLPPPAEGGEIAKSLIFVHPAHCQRKTAVQHDKRQIRRQQPTHAPLEKPQRIVVFAQRMVDAKAGQKHKNIHRAHRIPHGNIQLRIILKAAVIIEKVTIDHDQNRNAHQLGLIAADPLICVHTLTPYILLVIIPDHAEKSYIFIRESSKKESPLHADSPIFALMPQRSFLLSTLPLPN